MAFGQVFVQDTVGSPEQTRQLHFNRSGNQSQSRIWFILSTYRTSDITDQFSNSSKKYFKNCKETSEENLYVDTRAQGPLNHLC